MQWIDKMKIGTKTITAFALVGILTGVIAYIQTGQFPLIPVAGSLVLGAIMGFLISGSISRQIKAVAGIAEKMAEGNAVESAEIEAIGEIGGLAVSMKKLSAGRKESALSINRIAQGDFSAALKVRSDRDLLGKSLHACAGNVQLLKQEISRIKESAALGKLSDRCKSDLLKGDLAAILEDVNQILDSVVRPVGRAIGVMNKVAARDLTARLSGDYRGDHTTFQNALNLTIQTLEEAISQVSVSAEQVSFASSHISEGSQVLSQRASEQAGSIQQVSSSLHEVASMTRQNSENAKEARSLSKSAETAVEHGVESMNRLSEAIGRIKESSDSTAKIIKTIDEIAFQTNLLALNAAVEAARAGDAGKGFAVVAEEVRNLAMRSAEAAKNTANLIEESVRNSENGVNLNREVLNNLNEINGQVKKVGTVMAEIAAASEQQTQGVDQVNSVITQMNIVTQEIAANAEESASGAEELSGQAEELKVMVRAFQLSKGSPRIEKSQGAPGRAAANSPYGTAQTKDPAIKQQARAPQNALSTAAAAARMIPFDEADSRVLDEF